MTACQTTSQIDPTEIDHLIDEVPSNARSLFSGDFQQGWRERPELKFMPAHARLYAGEEAFHVVALLADRAIGNTASGFNQRTWQSGDVFEIFLQTDSDTYYEFHVTPENQHLFLAWTSELFEAVVTKQATLEDAMIDDPNLLQSKTDVRPDENLWIVRADIPYASIGFDPAAEHPDLKVAFARYDTTPGSKDEVLSATAPFPKPSYHYRDAWHRIAW